MALVAACALSACSPAGKSGDADAYQLLDKLALEEMRSAPERAQLLGAPKDLLDANSIAALTDRSVASTEQARLWRLDQSQILREVDRSNLSLAAARAVDAATEQFAAAADLDRYGMGSVRIGWASPYIVNQYEGAYVDIVKLMTLHQPVATRAEADQWLAKLKKIGSAVDDDRRRLEIDLENGVVPPRAVLDRTLTNLRSLTPYRPREHPLYRYFAQQLGEMSDLTRGEVVRLLDEAAVTLANDVRPAYLELAKTLEAAKPHSPPKPGVWRQPNGDAYYPASVRLFTGSDLAPTQMSDMAKTTISKVSEEMDALLDAVGLQEGTPARRMQYLLANPNYLSPDAQASQIALALPALAPPAGAAGGQPAPSDGAAPPPDVAGPESAPPDARDIQAAILAQARKRQEWALQNSSRVIDFRPGALADIRLTPDIIAGNVPAGYYTPAALNGSRPGIFNLNLGPGRAPPAWGLATLTFHETIPGHHLQQEAERAAAKGALRAVAFSTKGFDEGWALYAEDLADELGAYKGDPMSRLGYLHSVLLRAARVVVDVGIHSERWTRSEAAAYLVETTGLPLNTVEKEIDRYTIWPGQACAYLVGREQINQLRAEADRELGADFDLKAFHAVILSGGSRPLNVVAHDVRSWIDATRKPIAARKKR